MAYKSSNPALNKKTFTNLVPQTDGQVMTLDGVAMKSLFLFGICILSGFFGWRLIEIYPQPTGSIALVAILAAFIIGIVTIFKKTWSPVTAPLYALVEGFALGVVSRIFEAAYGGIVLQALLLTAGIFLSMLFIYLFRIIKVTENFKLGVAAATAGVAIYYFASLILGAFNFELPLIASNSIYGIGFTVLVIILAALNLVVDFDFIETGVENRSPKYMEWYASFGLFVTVVWLYLELLRLLSKIRSR